MVADHERTPGDAKCGHTSCVNHPEREEQLDTQQAANARPEEECDSWDDHDVISDFNDDGWDEDGGDEHYDEWWNGECTAMDGQEDEDRNVMTRAPVRNNVQLGTSSVAFEPFKRQRVSANEQAPESAKETAEERISAEVVAAATTADPVVDERMEQKHREREEHDRSAGSRRGGM